MIGWSSQPASWQAAIAHWCRENLAEPVLSVLFPPRCVGCGDFETYLCARCRGLLRSIGPEPCPRCGAPGPVPLLAGRCSRCLGEQLPYVTARAAFRHEGLARRLVADFKFGGQPVLGRVMAEASGACFAKHVSSIAPPDRVVVTWVPSHAAAERQRGYNQAQVLARRLVSHGTQVGPPLELARKTRATKHQKELGRQGRLENLRGAFEPVPTWSRRVPSSTEAILVVDDVYTTGATAAEVSRVLGESSGLPVHVFTFSRAVTGAGERHD